MNIVIQNGFVQDSDLFTLFGLESIINSTAPNLETLMVELKIYQSKSKAIKDGRKGPIPLGFTEFKASKKKTIWIWNPSE